MWNGDHLNTYAEGWTKGDAAIILRSLDNSYTLDDPNFGKISKGEFAGYLAGFKQQVESLRGNSELPLLALT